MREENQDSYRHLQELRLKVIAARGSSEIEEINKISEVEKVMRAIQERDPRQ